jgi:hypothetical protein
MYVGHRVSFAVAVAVVLVACALGPRPASAAEWFVAPGSNGSGSSGSPFGRIQDALKLAQPGDLVTLRPGTYRERFSTVRNGTSGAPIRLRATGERGSVLVTTPGRVATVNHRFFVIENLVFDGQYGDDDTLRVSGAGHDFILRNSEVRRSTRDLIDIGAAQNVLIEGCLLHRALNAARGRTDAHGIAAGAVRNLTVRNTEIHTFSGDGLQVDPGRSAPGWDRVTLDGVRIWLAPLASAENGFAAGTVTGENAVDTKASPAYRRARLTIRNTTAWGFRNGLIGNMAAFNLKEFIDATVDRVTVHDSEIAFRLRGSDSSDTGARVALTNAVVYRVAVAYRYENNIRNLRIWNNTVGAGVTRAFRAASSSASGLDVRNMLVLGSRPPEASQPSNVSVDASAFVNAIADDYHLAAGSAAIDRGGSLSNVTTDRGGTPRPQGAGHDVGAYEWSPDDGEIVIHAGRTAAVAGAWRVVPDSTAASGARVWHPDAGSGALAAASGAPLHFFELTTWMEAGRTYRLWLRGRADSNSPANDSVYVQFSNALSSTGSPAYRIGTSSALAVSLEDCSGCGLGGWTWQDTATGVEVLGPTVRAANTGPQTIRIQTREDGISIDQVVLSPLRYLHSSPGMHQNDRTILPE